MYILTTITFLTLLVVLIYWSLPEKYRYLSVIAGTALILFHFSPISLVLLTLSTILCYWALVSLHNTALASIVVISILVVIFLFFKLSMGFEFNMEEHRIIPLGFSYYSFRMIHYAIERFKGTLPSHSFMDFTRYLFFLPTLLVGPINRFDAFLKDYKRLRFDADNIFVGLERILIGYLKIIVLGNYLFSHKMGLYARVIEGDYPWVYEYIEMVRFGANAYLQFSGYSDVAIGLALLFGYRVIENFNFPFLASNIADFWRRWHISLSSWCRDYIFDPVLAMSRNAIFAAIATMIILGGWHEISFRYIIWGLMHGLAIIIWSAYDKKTKHLEIRSHFVTKRILSPIITIHFVLLSFIIIRDDSLAEAWGSIQKLIFLN
jgi:alginate O-acetyltransferase complex protein AlgI